MPHSKTLTYLIGDIADTTVSAHIQKDHEEVLKILQELMEDPRTGWSLTGRVPWRADSTVRRKVIGAADSLAILLSIARVDTLIKSMEEDKKEIVGKLMRIENKKALLETPYDPRSRKYPALSDGS